MPVFDGFLKVYEVSQKRRRTTRTMSWPIGCRRLNEGEKLGLEELKAGAALSPSLRLALQRGFAGEGAGGAGNRAAVDVCLDHQHHPGPRVRGEAWRAAGHGSIRRRSGWWSATCWSRTSRTSSTRRIRPSSKAELDDIEEGKEKWTDLLGGFYGHFEKELKSRREADGIHQGDGDHDG